ncbi:MAG: DUF2784 family protein [Brachymonas sp.]
MDAGVAGFLRDDQLGYQSSFIEHYLLAAIYPEGLTRPVQIALGSGVLVINALIYELPWFLRKKHPQPAKNKRRVLLNEEQKNLLDIL